MEINKEKIKINYKAIFDYCFRVFVFLVLNRSFFAINIVTKVHDIFFEIFGSFLNFNFEAGDGFCLMFILTYVYNYLTAKFCGIFHKIKNFKFYYALLIVIIIEVLFEFSQSITIQLTPIIKINFYNVIGFPWFYTVLINFFIYTFLAILTEKTPFEKVEYYTSIEFFKNLYSKIIKK